MHGFGQIAFNCYIGFSSPFDIVKHFFLLYLENKDVQIKIFNFDPKPWVILFGKCQFFDLLNFCFYSLERRFFVLDYHKGHFPGLYCLKKKVGKMAIFGQQPWVNRFGKMSIFRFFELLVFIA